MIVYINAFVFIQRIKAHMLPYQILLALLTASIGIPTKGFWYICSIISNSHPRVIALPISCGTENETTNTRTQHLALAFCNWKYIFHLIPYNPVRPTNKTSDKILLRVLIVLFLLIYLRRAFYSFSNTINLLFGRNIYNVRRTRELFYSNQEVKKKKPNKLFSMALYESTRQKTRR